MEKLKEHYVVTTHQELCKWSGEFYTCKQYRLHYYRRVHTAQERLAAAFLRYDEDAKDYGVRARAKRNMRGLPSSWDDVNVAAWDYLKSWKHNSKRRKQWK